MAIYAAIDLKSFYASVECVERGLNPLTTHLVVADESRSEKTICLAVSPSLKKYGLPGRTRLFHVRQVLREVNAQRLINSGNRTFNGSSYNAPDLEANADLEATMIVAKPRMQHYLQTSARIYQIYLRYAAAQDIHVYSIDEVFIDITSYVASSGLNAHEFVTRIIQDIARETGITATAGIGTNLYLCKVAMDIVAKHIEPNKQGVRVAELDEYSYRQLLWAHEPLTDFWRVGRGIASTCNKHGLYTMGDIARCSLGKSHEYYNEELLYRLFGVNAELLIDHAWGVETTTMADIKQYKPQEHGISSGQVLPRAYTAQSARIIVKEMTDALALELTAKQCTTKSISLSLGYEAYQSDEESENQREYTYDWYGKVVPKPTHVALSLPTAINNGNELIQAMTALYDTHVNTLCTIRRIGIGFGQLRSLHDNGQNYSQPDLFTLEQEGTGYNTRISEHSVQRQYSSGTGTTMTDTMVANAADKSHEAYNGRKESHAKTREQTNDIQRTILQVKQRFGANAVLKGMNLEEDATGRQRNQQIGGHAA